MITSHSRWPCLPSKSRILTATDWGFKPDLSLSSIKPLYTCPKPPSPRKLVLDKLCVMFFSSLSVKIWRFDPNCELDRSLISETTDDELLRSESDNLRELICFETRHLDWSEADDDDEFWDFKHEANKDLNMIFLRVIFFY